MHKKRKNKYSIGTPLSILDKNNNVLYIGDTIKYKEYQGILLYNFEYEEYGIFFGQWYGEDIYDSNSYGKFIGIPMDNGARMTIEKIHSCAI